MCELIALEQNFDSKLLNFLKIEKKKNGKLSNIDLVDDLIIKLEEFKGLKKICFKFNESILINAMKKGEWILLEDIHYAPQEIERLMSLLEENPTLTIYENSPILFFSKEKNSKDKKENEN